MVSWNWKNYRRKNRKITFQALLVFAHTCKLSRHIVPSDGHSWGGMESCISNGASLGIFEYCIILSTEIILFTSLHRFHVIVARKTLRFNPYVTANPTMPACHGCQCSIIACTLTRKYENLFLEYKFFYKSLLGSITPSGKLTTTTKEKENTKFDSRFNLRLSHSMADMLWNNGLE